MTKKITPLIITVVFCLVIAWAVLAAWQDPGSSPPWDNVPAPINVGAQDQVKIGDICTQQGGYQCLSWLGGAAPGPGPGPAYWAQLESKLFPTDLTWHVGVGTNNPILGKIEVKPEVANAEHGITIYTGSGSSARSFLQPDGTGNFNWHLIRGTTLTRGITIDKNGRLGVAKTSPSQALDVAGNIYASGDICAFGGTNCLSAAAPGPGPAPGDITAVRTPAGSGLEGGAESGDVSLSVRTDCGVNQIIKWNGAAWICSNDQAGAAGVIDGSGLANNIARWQDSNTLTTSEIYQAGTSIGIGTDSPSAFTKLQVVGGGIWLDTNQNIRWYKAGEVGLPSISAWVSGINSTMSMGVAGSYQLKLTNTGLGIRLGGANPSYALDVNGQIYATGDICTTVGGGLKCLSASGALPTCLDDQIIKWSGGSWQCATDQTGGGLASDGFGVIADSAGTPQVSATAPTDTLRLGTAAGSGLSVTYNNSLKSVLFSADFNQTQRRVTGSCSAGSSIRVINSDGTVDCEIDDTGGPGAGVDGSGTANYIPRWLDSDTLTNSIMYQSGSRIEMGGILDMNKNQVENMVLHKVSSQAAEDAMAPVVGQIWIRTDL